MVRELTGEELAEIRDLQVAALTEKARGGSVLSRSELEQLGVGSGDNAEKSERGASAPFEVLVFGTARAAADWWGTSARTIERHRPKGLPFTRPWEAEDWWGENVVRKRPPVWLLDGVERWRRSQEEKPTEESPGLCSDAYLMEGDDWAIEDQVRTMRRIARGYASKLEELAGCGEEFARVDRLYQTSATKLRSLEKDAPGISIEQGRAWDKAQVASALTDVGTAMNAALDRFAALLAPMVAGQDEGRCAELISREVDRLRQPWSRCDFLTT